MEWNVSECIGEHVVLLRLQRENARYVQYIIAPPLMLYCTGALLAAYNMLSTQVYDQLGSITFQLILAFVTLMIPLVSGARITSICVDLGRLATNLDLSYHLNERQALIQQFVLLPENAFFVLSVRVSYSLLVKLSYVLIAGLVVLARGASLATPR